MPGNQVAGVLYPDSALAGLNGDVPGDVLKGELYSAIALNSKSRQLSFRCRQKLFLTDSLTAKIFGEFQGGLESPRWRVQVAHKRVIDDLGLKGSARLRYDSEALSKLKGLPWKPVPDGPEDEEVRELPGAAEV